MRNNNTILGLGLLAILLIVAAFLLPWSRVNWGKMELMQSQVVTVIGEAKTQQKNQVAMYSAGVYVINDDKNTAIKEVNEKVDALIKAVKDFGIPSEDIKTQSLSFYQTEEGYSDTGERKIKPGQWRVNNTVEIKLRDIDKASAFADLLASSGANNVYGPNFSFEDTSEIGKTLYNDAISDAREKAELIAKASNRKLGKVLSVNDGGTSNGGIYSMRMEGAGGGAPVEPGTGTVNKTVTVSFELQ